MGEVYRARDLRLGRDVAIKVLPAALAHDADRLRRFEQEARTIAALNHPNILGIHDIGAHNDAPFLVSECLEGQTLRDKLRSGPLPVRLATEYALGIAQGLSAAHEKGIVHRDLKPENVFVTRDGRVKVLDFGLAKLARPEEDRDPNESGNFAGHGHGYRRLHVAGAGARRTERLAIGHFQLRCSVVRNAHRPTRLQTPNLRGNDDRNFARRATGAERHRPARSAGTATDSCAMPGKECRAAFPVRQ
jgi:serine/threonine protein kinase